MNWKFWTRFKKDRVVIAALPGQSVEGEGFFDPTSQTAIWLRNWAREELRKAREENDKYHGALVTTKFRSRIETLKEVLVLPETKESAIDRHLLDLEMEFDEEGTFAGY